MDVADDADGRVAIFSIDGAEHRAAVEAPPPPRQEGPNHVPGRLGTWLDGRYAGAAAAAALVIILVIGLLLTRH